MDRITERTYHRIDVREELDICVETPQDYDNLQYILSVLAAYEDSGLDPGEIESVTFCKNKIDKLRKELRKERKRWHKVADGDLPQGPYNQKRKFYCKEKGYGYRILLYDDKGFYYYSYDLNIGIENEQIVAWMELPEYEEEQP
ncbi:hypothetical protein MUY40_27985 [Blautia sp. NSJ-159]|uniref:hypothetical protein n=1 Tax=unclassified Blautia TaxID=2648079 RepID=UPI001FD323BD|nr:MULTISPECIES: hypothetical protein [unclassified Blautia]MCJ8020785.1 hypothetical protein [Blautia sp. NSJ-159]MCJ8043733.1 hypothetical protein [Blautia sp. NSJ-165]